MPPPPPPPPAVADDGSCNLFRCFCRWRRVCSPRIPRVAPGRDYVCIPAGADDRPVWSLLVGFRAEEGLRLHRFRVAPSGRILGRSNDDLEIFHCATPICGVDATLSPDGRSLCLFQGVRPVDVKSTVVPVIVLKLQLDGDKRTVTQLPSLQLGRLTPWRPITVAGGIWVPYLQLLARSSCLLGMQHLDKKDGSWVEVGSITFPYEMEVPMKWGGSIFQGLAVVHDTILVSLRPAHLFFSFNCSTRTWTAITTNTNNSTSSKNTSIGTSCINTSTGNTTTPLETAPWSSGSVNPNRGSSCKNISTDNTTSCINTSTGSTTSGKKKRSSRREKKTSTVSTTSRKDSSTVSTTSGKDSSTGNTTSRKDTSTGSTTSGKDKFSGNTTHSMDTSSGNTTSGKKTSSDNTTSGKKTSSGNTTSGKKTSSGNTTSGKDTSSGNTTSGKGTSSGSTTLSLGTSVGKYVPIRGRGVYVEEDGAIYFLQNSTIFVYKLHSRGQGQQPLVELKPPTKIDSVCPFHPDGFGLLTHLGGRVMCSVWISVSCYCPCEKYHVIISTFRVKYCSDDIPIGIEILHSTCRQLDMLPCKPTVPTHEFCFLQEYEEYNYENAMARSMQNAMARPMPHGVIEDPTSSYAEDSSEMLPCCRKFLSEPPFPRCYELQKPAVQITRDLFVVCQAGSRLIVYWTKIVAGRLMSDCSYSPLRLHADMNTAILDSDRHVMKQPSPRYFVVRSLTSIYAVSYKPDDTCEFELSRPSSKLLKTSRPAGVCFAVVLNVGHRIVAVSHALEVYLFVPPRSRFDGNYPAPTDYWKHYKTRRPVLAVNRTVELSGYVVLDADTFIVSDKETCRCFLMNLKVKEWEDVLPDDESRTLLFHDPLVYGRQRLNGRSIYVGGYIYSCTPGGLVAYDFGDGLLNDRIGLRFSWRKKDWESERMCLDLVGTVDGAVLFCVVQGEFLNRPGGQHVYFTIVQVKTRRTPAGKFRPVSIDHVDIATCFIPREDRVVSTSSCFSV